MRVLKTSNLLAAALLVMLHLPARAAPLNVDLPERNPVREAELPLPERNPEREAAMPLPERNPVREAELPVPERNPLRIVPPPSAEAHGGKDGGKNGDKSGRWPKLLPGTPEILKTWSEEETKAERARCVEVLKDIAAEVEEADPVRDGGCGSAAPVKLISMGKALKVTVSPPATMTCDLAVALTQWMEKDVQPAARRILGKPVTKISNISDYSCRNAPSRVTTRLSEHALANALDVRDFITEDGQIADVKRDWGPVARDIAAQIAAEKAAEAARRAAEEAARLAKEAAAKAAAEKAAAEKAGGKAQAEPKADPKAQAKIEPKAESKADTKLAANKGDKGDAKSDAKEVAPPEPADNLSPRELRQLKRAERQKAREEAREVARQAAEDAARLKRGGPSVVMPASASMAAAAKDPGPRGQFLREIHDSACGTFGTVLGPEANDAHRDHFHLDMAKRRYKSFCE